MNYTQAEFPNLTLNYQLLTPTSGGTVENTATINADGSFALKIPYPFPYQQIILQLGEFYEGEIIAHEGLTLELDMVQLQLKPVQYLGKGLQFGGPDAAINVYRSRFQTFSNKEKSQFYIDRQNLIMNNQLETQQQLAQYQKIYQTFDEIIKAYTIAHPSEYDWVLKDERDSDYYGWLFTLFWQKQIPQELLNEALEHQPYLLSTATVTYYKYLARLMKLIAPDRNYELTRRVLSERVFGAEKTQELTDFLVQYQQRLNQQPFDERVFQHGIRQFLNPNREVIRKAKLEEFALNLVNLDVRLADLLKLFAAPSNKWQRKGYYKKFLAQTGTNWVSTFMIDEVGVIETYTTSIPKALPEATSITINNSLGTPVKQLPIPAGLYLGEATNPEVFVATLQNAFPGKALILDIWATWCRPCIVDMKRSKARKAALKDLPLEIIYLAVAEGSSQQKWEQTVNELAVSGTHIYIQEELGAALLKHFYLFGYPSYIFIDSNGNWDANFIRSIANLDLDLLREKL